MTTAGETSESRGVSLAGFVEFRQELVHTLLKTELNLTEVAWTHTACQPADQSVNTSWLPECFRSGPRLPDASVASGRWRACRLRFQSGLGFWWHTLLTKLCATSPSLRTALAHHRNYVSLFCALFTQSPGTPTAAGLPHVYNATLVEFVSLVFTRMPGESYRRRLRSLLL